MKKLVLPIVLLLSVANLQAQSISHIETTKNWKSGRTPLAGFRRGRKRSEAVG